MVEKKGFKGRNADGSGLNRVNIGINDRFKRDWAASKGKQLVTHKTEAFSINFLGLYMT